ncbi:MAG TPA: endonuclease domain-containing protein [Chitinophagales bacterium]|nr:endonuclease domain-containing protein [Chitinophagales bacterium]
MRRTYKKYLNNYARTHRVNSTKAEIRLWCEFLRKRQLKGYRFRRQVPIGKFIADFFCQELDLVIEVDGFTHEDFQETVENDKLKNEYYHYRGLNVLRFSDDQVFNGLNGIRERFEAYIVSYGG